MRNITSHDVLITTPVSNGESPFFLAWRWTIKHVLFHDNGCYKSERWPTLLYPIPQSGITNSCLTQQGWKKITCMLHYKDCAYTSNVQLRKHTRTKTITLSYSLGQQCRKRYAILIFVHSKGKKTTCIVKAVNGITGVNDTPNHTTSTIPLFLTILYQWQSYTSAPIWRLLFCKRVRQCSDKRVFCKVKPFIISTYLYFYNRRHLKYKYEPPWTLWLDLHFYYYDTRSEPWKISEFEKKPICPMIRPKESNFCNKSFDKFR